MGEKGGVARRDTNDLQSSRAVGFLELYKPRYFSDARRTPGGPKIEDDRFATKIGQTYMAAVEIGQ